MVHIVFLAALFKCRFQKILNGTTGSAPSISPSPTSTPLPSGAMELSKVGVSVANKSIEESTKPIRRVSGVF